MSDLACSTRARFPSTEARRLIVALPYFNDTQSVGGVVMAQRTMTVCDIDDRRGDTVVATAAVRLDLAGEVHQLDVCAAHLDELRAALTAVLPSSPVSRRGGRGRRQRLTAWAEQPGVQQRRPAVGARPRHRGQGPGPDVEERGRAVPRRARLNSPRRNGLTPGG